jgi:phospholipid-binding lipoprotein MlaA
MLRHATRPLAYTFLLAAALATSACTSRPAPAAGDAVAQVDQVNDPLEGTNRFLYRINDGLDTYVFRPVAVGYRRVVPGGVRRSVHNVLANVSSPVLFVNDVLQTKPRRAGDTMMRFLINSTAGAAGLFDVATGWGYPAHGTDLGVTLALWGVGDGPYLFVPVIGPSGARDLSGYAGDILVDPLTWASFGGSAAVDGTRFGVGAVDARERLIDTVDDVKRNALDPYATFRSVYRQNRRSVIEATRNDRRATVPAWFNR